MPHAIGNSDVTVYSSRTRRCGFKISAGLRACSAWETRVRQSQRLLKAGESRVASARCTETRVTDNKAVRTGEAGEHLQTYSLTGMLPYNAALSGRRCMGDPSIENSWPPWLRFLCARKSLS